MNWEQRLLALALLALAGLGSPSFAQPPNLEPIPETEDGADDIVCISVLYGFRASLEQTRDIQTTPVPAGFFRDHPPGSCTSGPLPEDLIVWHLAFGTEDSALAAVDAIAARSLGGGAKADIRKDLAKAWKIALRDFNKLKKDVARDPNNKTLKASLRTAEYGLYGFMGAANTYALTVSYYLEIADSFASPRALAKAESILAMEMQARAFIAEDVAKDPDPFVKANWKTFEADWNYQPAGATNLRAAVLRARLDGTPETIDAALKLLTQVYTPAMQEAWRLIHERPDNHDICRIPDRMDVLSEACDATPDFYSENVPRFLYLAAQLELVIVANPGLYPQQLHYYDRTDPTSRPGPFRVDEMVRWLDAIWSDQWDRRSREWSDLTRFQFTTLQLMQADLAAAVETRRGKQGYYESVRIMLDNIERRVSPAKAPTIFRRIAERYLALHATELAVTDPDSIDHFDRNYARTAAYYRHTLDKLDAIAVGE